MTERRYLLNIEQMLEDRSGDALFRRAFDRIDRERRRKVLLIKNTVAQAAGIGAGLLIQKALTDYMAEYRTTPEAERLTEPRKGRQAGCLTEPMAEQSIGQERPGSFETAEKPALECFSVEELLSMLGRKVTEPCYRYGKNGKPYLTDYPFLFNLSHSGDYVFCGVSGQEIGVDIQKIQGDHGLRVAKRFFAGPERKALEACGDEERRQMFFRMWVRKEAYGKLTGVGIAETVEKCLWRDVSAGEELSSCGSREETGWENGLIWEEYDKPDGYRTAVCRFRRATVQPQ